jgi:hypothetical protein
MTRSDDGPDYNRVWKAKIPEKIKTFMWLVEQNAILTKDTLLRRNWQGDPSCYFCESPETIDHLFFECPIAKVIWGVIAMCFHQKCRPKTYSQYWAWIPNALPGGSRMYMVGLAAVCWTIWKGRNRVCYEKKQIKNPGELLFSACGFLRYWAGLQRDEDQRQLINAGVNLMMRTATKLLRKEEPKTHDGN